ncbi:MAG: excinuclease ABC subunit UvrA [Deltaproteobacteria bacterium]|nr:excinuclease ABC subunit UvrA [Deltaproteobacteria bacterium]
MAAPSRPARRSPAGVPAAPAAAIHVEDARSHNLRGVTCSFPLQRLSVVTGVSGSGKSTLAFDTLYAEGQRRYVASLSTYARQFLERLPRPEVGAISHLPPAIAIEQRNRVTNARSTVGTATEILDLLRLLWAKTGQTRCPHCDLPAAPGTAEAVADRILARAAGRRASLGTALGSGKRESATALRERLLRDGWSRLLDASGRVVELEPLAPRELNALRAEALLLIDRLAPAPAERARLVEAVASGFARGDGELVVAFEDGERARYREGFACDGCGRRFPPPEPALFSFNSPLGACPRCQGFGRVQALDLARVVPDESLSLAGGAIAPFQTPKMRSSQRDLLRACKRLRLPVAKPWRELDAAQRALVVEGDEARGGDWYGVRGFFEWLEGKRYKVQARVLIARYRRFDPCPDCGGARLRPEARQVFVDGRDLPAASRMTIAELHRWLATLALAPGDAARGGRIVDALRARVGTAQEVGLGYLALDRQTRTLSGGEAQRIQLAAALGGTLTASLYVLDEPSVGLHARDVARLLAVLRRIRDQGNTVVLVEHAPEIIAAADHVIDLGPGAGRLGGSLVAEGSVADVRAHRESLTGRVLRGDFAQRPRPRRRASGRLRIVGARAHNLRDVSVDVPLGQLVCVTGVSGAGKSSLVRSVLVGHLTRDPERGPCTRIEGADAIGGVVLVGAAPLARSPRSNPATVSKAFDAIRRRFAATREARALGASAGWFSFNVPGGRCEACEGAGEVVVDMQFLEDLRVPCERCEGRRYRPEALAVRLAGRSIVDVLGMTLDEASAAFADEPQVAQRLAPLVRVGLGYLTLGQPLSTLSGGEVQRLRIAQALAEGRPRALYVLDEPTTGLHAADVEVLLACLDELLATGSSVVLVEHNLDVIRRADWVIDLGPEGGPGGGRIVAEGAPAAVAAVRESLTGAALRGELA